MKKYNLITPEGTRDLLFDECRARREIENKLMDLFRSEGYSEVITPSLEFYDVFSGSVHGFPQESMYKLTDAKGRLMVIRPDSTIPIIRLAETRLKNEARPLKLCYNQTVYNVNPKEAGRDDEIAQCGVERIGTRLKTLVVLKLAVEAFKVMGYDYRFEIGNCKIFNRLILENNINASEKEKIRHMVETKNNPALIAAGVPKELVELSKLFGGAEVFKKARKLYKSEKMRENLSHLEGVYTELCNDINSDRITIDLGLTNTRGYYTGILFNGYIEGYGEPVLTGGKYIINNTVATGFAVNVSAIAALRGKS